MRKHVIVIDGVARVGEHYPSRARHKETGEVVPTHLLIKAGVLPGNIKIIPETDAVGLWGEWEPVYRTPAEIVAKFHPDKRAKVTGARRIAAADIPADKSQRDAWEDDGARIVVNPAKVRSAPVAPLSAEELYDVLEAKGVLRSEDRPRGKPQ